jgi:hypothetical protein
MRRTCFCRMGGIAQNHAGRDLACRIVYTCREINIQTRKIIGPRSVLIRRGQIKILRLTVQWIRFTFSGTLRKTWL